MRSHLYPVIVAACLLLAGCATNAQQKAAAPPPPPVDVVQVTAADVPIVAEYPAQTYARNTVDVRARVEGYVEKWLFAPGQTVTAGQPLYVLDLRPLQAAVTHRPRATCTRAKRIWNSPRDRCPCFRPKPIWRRPKPISKKPVRITSA